MEHQILALGKRAKAVATQASILQTQQKHDLLHTIAQALISQTDFILTQNQIDITQAKENGISEVMIDRLSLTKERILSIANAIQKVIDLPDQLASLKAEKNVQMVWRFPKSEFL